MIYTHAVQAAMEGREEGYSFLYQHTYRDKYYVALKYMGNEADAQDVLQEAYAKAFRKLGTLQDHEKFPQWFGMIVANTAKNTLEKKRAVTFSDIAPENDEGETFELQIEDEHTGYQPETAYTQKETQELVREMIGALSDEQRMCILMFYMENQSIREIAETLGCSENTVKSRLNYGRKALRGKAEDLENRGYKLRAAMPLPFLLGSMELEKQAMDFGNVAELARAVASKASASAAAGASETAAANAQAAAQTASGTATATADVPTVPEPASSAVAFSHTAGQTTAQSFIHTTAGKIAVAVVTAVLLGGGGFGIYKLTQPQQEAPTAQAQQETKQQEETVEGVVEEAELPEEETVDLAEVYSAYTSVLTENESGIRAYDWQVEATEDYQVMTVQKPAALCDINGDDIPELFFFTAANMSVAELHIYSYRDGAATEMDYDMGQGHSMGEDRKFTDVLAASGVQYVIYKTTEPNRFIIYFNDAGDETQGYRLYEYEMDADGNVETVNVLDNEYGPNDDYTATLDLFWQNGQEISADVFAVEFEDALSSIEQVILYSGRDDTSIWRRFDPADTLFRSYDEILAELAAPPTE